MGSEVLLRSACELSYQIARDGMDADPSIDPPAAMRSFLSETDLPERALTVAQQAIEDDPAFRRRVAERADEDEVGRAGYLWLHRPIGWAAEFEELANQPPSADAELPLDDDETGGALAEDDVIPDDVIPDDGPALVADDLVDDDLVEGEPLDDADGDPIGAADAEPVEDADGDGGFGSDDPSGGYVDDQGGLTVADTSDRLDAFTGNGIVDDDPVDGEDRPAADLDVVGPSPDGDEAREQGQTVTAGAASALGFGSIDTSGNGEGVLDLPLSGGDGGRSEANAIEDELSSLRGLVDRLSSERKAVSSSVRRIEQEAETSKQQPSMFDSDIYTLQSELDSARAELDQARIDRDVAVRQHSESLTRQLELEKELDRSRELRAEIEREHADVDSSLVELRETLARTEASLSTMEQERADLRTEVAELATTNESLNTQVARISEEQAAQVKGLQADLSALQAEADSLRLDKAGLASKLSTVETELNDAQAQLSQTGNQASEAKSLVDALTEEKIDLASRLADTEAMLETTRVQLGAVKSDAEAVTADLSNIKAHRDGLATQVEELHGSLTEALNDLARVRSASDADRAALKDVRAERDLLRVRVGSLEQIETGLEAKLANLSAERDSFVANSEQAQSQVGELQRELRELAGDKDRLAQDLSMAENAKAAAVAERDQFQERIKALEATVAELEASGSSLSQQVEQLTEENSAIQAQLVESDRLRSEAAENQGHALSELAQRLSSVENERSRLEADLREAEGRLADSLVTLEAARDEVERARRQRAGDDPGSDPFGATTQFASVGTGSVEAPPTTEEPAPPAASSVLEGVGADVAPVDDPPPPGPGDGTATTVPDSRGERDEAPDFPPPAIGDEPATEAPAEAEQPEAPVEEAEQPEPEAEQGRGKRPLWGIGALRRGDSTPEVSDPEPPPPPPLVEDEAPSPTIENTFDLSPAAQPDDPAPTPAVADAEVSDAEIDSISTELAAAVGDAAVEVPASDDDLDEISNLISQTMTDFESTATTDAAADTPAGDGETAETADDPNDDDGDSRLRRGRRLFADRSGGRRKSGPLPPSVFGQPDEAGDGEAGDDETAVLAEPDDVSSPDLDPATTAATPAATGRRRIEIPADLLDDEVAMARHVVSSPDVVLLVDGDSVAKMGWPSLPVSQQRDALVSYLADLSVTSGAAPDVVFDGRIGEEESLPSSRAVRIRLSTPPTEPAAALDELVDAYPEQWPIAIVTDEDDLGRSAADRGAVVLNNGQLLDLFIS